MLGIGVVGATGPALTVATPPHPILPLTQAAFGTTFATNRSLTAPVTIDFSSAMDPASLAAALDVEPATRVDLTWNPGGTMLTITPRPQWAAGTLHTITIDAGALARSGQPLAQPSRAAFLTRAAAIATLAATQPAGSRVAVTTGFLVTFDRPVDPDSVAGAIHLDPPAAGTLQWVPTANGLANFTFRPLAPLRSDTAYRLTVSGVRDSDGVAVATTALATRTASSPAVLRFRPRGAPTGIARNATISVRFSEAMDRNATARAFSVKAAGRAVAGRIAWAEGNTVLVFSPTTLLPSATTVSMQVALGARSATGAPLAVAAHDTFRTATPAAAATTTATPPPSSTGSGSSTAGSATTSGSWIAVERYYLGLMNCTRTGGWVTSTGRCSSPGGRNVAPLILDSGISSKVSRPYARKLAINNECSHFIGGNPGDRLRRAGYTSYRWAENMGCRSGSAMGAVLASHLFFQSEKSTGGGHYVNLMNAAYNRVGIGVWVSGGRVRLVVDFYHG